MVPVVKADPPPRGEGGQARTRLARRAVIDAARALFLERGYQATTIDAISERADVPPATVYRLFSSKVGILKALLDVSIAGDDRSLSLPERADVAALFEEQDPQRLLVGFAGMVVDINTRSGDIYRLLTSAAGSDPAASEVLANYQHQRDEGQGQMARALARTRALRPALRERDAADLIHALASPELYRLLVVDRGWTPARYERWLVALLADQLIGEVPTSTSRSRREASD